MAAPVAVRAKARREAWVGAAFAAPAGLLLLGIYLVPCAVLLALAFTDYELGAVTLRFVGLENFAAAFEDEVFRRARSPTPSSTSQSCCRAAYCSAWLPRCWCMRARARAAFYEVIYFLPVTSTLIAMATVWQFVLHPSARAGQRGAARPRLGESRSCRNPRWCCRRSPSSACGRSSASTWCCSWRGSRRSRAICTTPPRSMAAMARRRPLPSRHLAAARPDDDVRDRHHLHHRLQGVRHGRGADAGRAGGRDRGAALRRSTSRASSISGWATRRR
jgi:hypothetical protein